MGRGLPMLILIGAMCALSVRAASAESSANTKAILSPAPAPSGPYEQTAIRRTGPTTSSTAQGKSSTGPSNAWDMAKVPMALGGVLLLIFGMRALGKKMVPGGAGRSSRAVQVLVRSTVSPRQQLMLIQVGRRLVLVGSGGTEMNPLCQIDDPDEVAEVLGHIREDKGSSVAKNFRTLFGKAGKAYEAPGDEAEERPGEAALSTAGTRAELTGLTEQVRRIAEQFREA